MGPFFTFFVNGSSVKWGVSCGKVDDGFGIPVKWGVSCGKVDDGFGIPV